MAEQELDAAKRQEIERACERLVRQYALFVDGGDLGQLESLFARDASFARPTAPDSPIRGRDAIMAGFRKRPQDRVTRHVVSNCVIDALDAAQAAGRSYMILYQGPRDAAGGVCAMDKPVFVGGFRDRFVVEDGAWRFAARIGDLALTGA